MSKIAFLDIFILKKINFVSKNKHNFRFFPNVGQLQKLQKSAKGLISFFCKVNVSPLIGKKLAGQNQALGEIN